MCKSGFIQNGFKRFFYNVFPKFHKLLQQDTPLATIEIKRHELWVKAFDEIIQKEMTDFETCLEKELQNLEDSDQKQAWKAWRALAQEPIATRLVKFARWSLDQEKIHQVKPCQKRLVASPNSYFGRK